MFQTKVVQKIKTNFTFSKLSLSDHAVYDVIWKKLYSPTGHRWQYNTTHAHCMLHN